MAQTGALMGFVHRRRRGAELFLLVLALAVGIGAYAAVGIGVEGEVPADIIGYGGWLAALIIVAHVTVRLVAPYADPVLLPVVAALNGLGLAIIHRLDLAKEAAGRPDGFAQQQLIWMTLGVGLFVATLVVLRDHRVLQRFTYTSGLAAIVLLLLPIVPGLGKEINGARIWIGVGPFSFQPGEVAKVLLVVAFAGYLVLHRDALALAGKRVLFVDLPRGRDLGPVLAMWLVSLGILVFQRDLGSSLLFFGLFLIMLYVATERPGWLIVGGGLFLAGAYAAYNLFAHVAQRVDVWLNPFDYYSDAQGGKSFQPVEAMFGMAWGGLIGRGFGDGTPDRVPYAESDFILAAIGEGLPEVVDFVLRLAADVERGRLGERELGAAVQRRELESLEQERRGHRGAGRARSFLAVARDALDLRLLGAARPIVEHLDVELGGLFGLVVEPQERGDLLHVGSPFLEWCGGRRLRLRAVRPRPVGLRPALP